MKITKNELVKMIKEALTCTEKEMSDKEKEKEVEIKDKVVKENDKIDPLQLLYQKSSPAWVPYDPEKTSSYELYTILKNKYPKSNIYFNKEEEYGIFNMSSVEIKWDSDSMGDMRLFFKQKTPYYVEDANSALLFIKDYMKVTSGTNLNEIKDQVVKENEDDIFYEPIYDRIISNSLSHVEAEMKMMRLSLDKGKLVSLIKRLEKLPDIATASYLEIHDLLYKGTHKDLPENKRVVKENDDINNPSQLANQKKFHTCDSEQKQEEGIIQEDARNANNVYLLLKQCAKHLNRYAEAILSDIQDRDVKSAMYMLDEVSKHIKFYKDEIAIQNSKAQEGEVVDSGEVKEEKKEEKKSEKKESKKEKK